MYYAAHQKKVVARRARTRGIIKSSSVGAVFPLVLLFSLLAFRPVHGFEYPKTTVQERSALIDLYQATTGSRWKIGWDITGGPCADGWYGIICSREGHVISLALNGNNLRGQIPASFTQLTWIESVDLSTNFLSGPLPDSLESLVKIERFDLRKNHLTGDPTNSGLWSCPLLQSVALHSNKFEPIRLKHNDPIDAARARGVLVSFDMGPNSEL